MKNFIIIFTILLAGCTSSLSKESLINFSFPIQPADNEIVIYIANESAYLSDWAYFSLELNGEYKIINFGDCTYFILENNEFILRSKRNREGYPITEFSQNNLNFGETYYLILKGTGKSSVSPFRFTTKEKAASICAEHGFGRVMNNPPNERWGKNDLR